MVLQNIHNENRSEENKSMTVNCVFLCIFMELFDHKLFSK